MSPSPADVGLTSPWDPWLSLLSLSSPSLRDVWQHWHDTWHMHRSQISTLPVILTQIRPECPCWSDYRASYLLDQLMGWMSGDCMHPLQSATVTCFWVITFQTRCIAPVRASDVHLASLSQLTLHGRIITPVTPGPAKMYQPLTDLQDDKMLESYGHLTSYNSSLGVTNSNTNTLLGPPLNKQQHCHFESSGHDSDNYRQDHWNSWMGRTS